MKKLFYLGTLIGLLLLSSCEKEETNEIDTNTSTTIDESLQKFGWDYNYTLASTTKELSRLMDNPKVNIVRNERDFRRFIQTEPVLRTVFSDAKLYKEVVSTMKFNRRGLKTYSFKSIKEAYPNRYRTIIVAMSKGFGLDLWLTTDYEDYECSAPATCTTDSFSICIGANC